MMKDDSYSPKNQVLFISNFMIRCVREDQSEKLLHRSIGAIFANSVEDHAYGTGVLISKDLILTAAHNIYNPLTKKDHDLIQFTLQTGENVTDFQEIESYRYPRQYVAIGQKAQYDYALMKLKKPVKFTQFMVLEIPCEKCLVNKEIGIFGYPEEIPAKFHQQTSPNNFRKDGKAITLIQQGLYKKRAIMRFNHTDKTMDYDISTAVGQSGSPVVTDNKIIGVHLSGTLAGKRKNTGRIIDSTLLYNLAHWKVQLNSSDFQFNKISCEHLIFRTHRDFQLNKISYENLIFRKHSGQIPSPNQHVLPPQQPTFNTINGSFLDILELQKFPGYKHVIVKFNNITKLKTDLPTEIIDAGSCQIQEIELTKSAKLIILKIDFNKISKIDIQKNAKLEWIDISSNIIKEINLDNNTKLKRLNLTHNQISQIKLAKNTQLTHLYLSKNYLTQIDISQNKQLKHFDISSNRLAQIDCTKNRKLKRISIKQNCIQKAKFSLQFSNFIALMSKNPLKKISFTIFKGSEIQMDELKRFFQQFSFPGSCHAELKIILEDQELLLDVIEIGFEWLWKLPKKTTRPCLVIEMM